MVSSDSVFGTDCAALDGEVEAGGVCTTQNDCARGTTCVQPGGICFQGCLVGGASTCPAPAECIRHPSHVVVGSVEYGICEPS